MAGKRKNMSGKGKQNSKKFREGGKHSNQNLETSPEAEETASLPVLRIADNAKHLPRYTMILQRSAEEAIGMEDLDILQLELETLLSSVVVRSRILQEEVANMSCGEERRDRRSKSGKGVSQMDKRVKEEKPKYREVKTQSPHSAKLLKQRTIRSSANQVVPNPHEPVRIEGSKSEVPMLNLPLNENLNKFWASVDPYCTDIMPDDIKLLEELIATHGDISEFKKIPSLGRHYSTIWAQNDLMQEEEAANSNKEKNKGRSDVSLLLAKGDKKANDMSGPLTQRLVSALLEENVYIANNNSENKMFRDGDPPVLRDLSIQNSMNLEMRMHKELVEQGLLDPDTPMKNAEDDEILAEIKRCQQQLQVLSSHNVSQLRKLLHLAQEESKRQALKRKISTIDKEVVEHYNKVLVSKQGKVPLLRKEQEKAWSCLRERESLLEQLNALPANCIGEPVPNAMT